jgi:SAM-dependent methyltransferase
MQTIIDYYDKLAKDYDSKRFGNSYGRYVDRMEREILHEWLNQIPPNKVLDVGCGTGRLLDFAMTGMDPSQEMIKFAAVKFPDRHLIPAGLPHIASLGDATFQAVICFHVLMHLDQNTVEKSIQSIGHLVKTGGHLIFDIPSQDRRAIFQRYPGALNWHGSTAATREDVNRWIGPHWRIVKRRGILFFPIHRLPSFARGGLCMLDEWIGKTRLARYSSYHVYCLERLS